MMNNFSGMPAFVVQTCSLMLNYWLNKDVYSERKGRRQRTTRTRMTRRRRGRKMKRGEGRGGSRGDL